MKNLWHELSARHLPWKALQGSGVTALCISSLSYVLSVCCYQVNHKGKFSLNAKKIQKSYSQEAL